MSPGRDDEVTRANARAQLHTPRLPDAQLDGNTLRQVVDDAPYEGAVAAIHHGLLRHHQRFGALGHLHIELGEEPRAQLVLRIRDARLDEHAAAGRVDTRIYEVDVAREGLLRKRCHA